MLLAGQRLAWGAHAECTLRRNEGDSQAGHACAAWRKSVCATSGVKTAKVASAAHSRRNCTKCWNLSPSGPDAMSMASRSNASDVSGGVRLSMRSKSRSSSSSTDPDLSLSARRNTVRRNSCTARGRQTAVRARACACACGRVCARVLYASAHIYRSRVRRSL
eukprot:6184367-Pleurochrysis_carterae.AAC.5